MARLGIIATVLLVAGSSLATTIHVPADQPTIQAGIDAASNSDTVLVAPGTYSQPFDYLGKNICVKGELGAESTIITYPTTISSLIKFVNGEDTLAILDGFTVRDVTHVGDGEGVIRLQSSSARIRNCRFINNKDLWPAQSGEAVVRQFNGYLIVEDCYFSDNQGIGGAAIGTNGGTGRIQRNTFKNNFAHTNYGGALSLGGVYGPSSFLVENNLFVDNVTGGNIGGAIFLSDNNGTVVRNNTFVRNTAPSDGGAVGVWYYSTGITVENNIFVGNSPFALSNNYGSEVSADGNLLYGNLPSDTYSGSIVPGTCDIVSDPMLCDTANGSFHIEACSPCFSANNNCTLHIGAFGIGCHSVYCGPVWHVATSGSDDTGDGGETNPFETIQHGINAASNGDTVLVADGTYTGDGNHDIDLQGKAIVVKSENGPDYTTIDCGSWHDPKWHGFLFHSDEGDSCVVDGFTVTNDHLIYMPTNGGGVTVENASPVIRNCVFEYGGVQHTVCDNASPSFSSCVFRFNMSGLFDKLGIGPASMNAGTLEEFWPSLLIKNQSSPSFINCQFYENLANDYGDGGAVVCMTSSPTFDHCAFTHNYASSIGEAGGGALYLANSQAMFDSCLFDSNEGGNGGAIYTCTGSTITLNGCTLRGNQAHVNGLAVSSNSSSVFLNGCVLERNSGSEARHWAGCVIALGGGTCEVTQCTFVGNGGEIDESDPEWLGLGVAVNAAGAQLVVNNSLFISNEGRDVIHCDSTASATISCSDIYGNIAEEWVGCIADQAGLNGNISLHPLFCDSANGDYSLFEVSPCAAANNSCGQLIGAHDVGCSLAATLTLPDEADSLHVLSHTPHLAWVFEPASLFQQTEYEIEVGTDNDWAVAEMWNPDIIPSSERQVVYAGASLLDGASYYARVRSKLNGIWTPWYETCFRVDNVPTSPSVVLPTNGNEVKPTDWLIWTECYDADTDDSVSYTLEIDGNSDFSSPEVIESGITDFPEKITPPAAASAVVGVIVQDLTDAPNLQDDFSYFWRVKAVDKFGGESAFTDGTSFFSYNSVNSVPLPPTSGFSPSNDAVTNDLTPTISWYPGTDPDESDNGSVLSYELRIDTGTDPAVSFEQADTTASGVESCTLAEPLADETRWFYTLRTIDDEGLVSEWSAVDSFWTNNHSDTPSVFVLIYPPPDEEPIIYDMLPSFSWSESIDSDPLDHLQYTLTLATDPKLVFSHHVTGIAQQVCQFTDSLSLDTHYWWTVRATDQTGLIRKSDTADFWTWTLGDVSHDNDFTLGDIMVLVDHLFISGIAITPPKAGDVNHDCEITLGDIMIMVDNLFISGAELQVGCE